MTNSQLLLDIISACSIQENIYYAAALTYYH